MEFERLNGQVNRAIRKGSGIFCSILCAKRALTSNLTGKRFGILTAVRMCYPNDLKTTKTTENRTHWLCRCDCGKERVVAAKYLLHGDSKSCGCLSVKRSYGQTKNPEYCVWTGMQHRCYDKKNEKYPDYGGRGIIVCDRWLQSFSNFLDDMGGRPTPKHTIDRINNNGNYEKENCRWATSKEQARNKRNNRWIEYNGQKLIIQDWAKLFNVNMSTLHERLKNGQPFEDIFNYYKIKNGAFQD